MLLTAELDRLSATDWQPFFAPERAKPYFAELDAFVTAAAAERTIYPRTGEYLRGVSRLPGCVGEGGHSGAGPLP